MSPRLRVGVPVLLLLLVLGAAFVWSASPLTPSVPSTEPSGTGGPPETDVAAAPTPTPTPTERPGEGGTELYGYLPYWQMSESMAAYLDRVPISTLALFSVSARRNGAIDDRDLGYKRITGALGRQLIADAHARRRRVEVVFTSFGEQKNGRFFGRLPLTTPSVSPTASPGAGPSPASSSSPTPVPTPTPMLSGPPPEPPWHRSVAELADLAGSLGVDGINVDVEQLDDLDRAAYGEFLRALRAALRAVAPHARLTVATEAGLGGTASAAAAIESGVDRIFLMGYDYHWSSSQPGASSPVDRSDGLYTLRWSIDQYVAAGVPRDRILLGLPLYGMSWKTLEPDRRSLVLGKGSTWIPTRHRDVLLDPAFVPSRDALEIAEFFVRPDGDAWRITYYDSPATLRMKLAFARDQGLAGGGLWAIGYERGLPGYLDLMRDFTNGKVDRAEAPPAPG